MKIKAIYVAYRMLQFRSKSYSTITKNTSKVWMSLTSDTEPDGGKKKANESASQVHGN